MENDVRLYGRVLLQSLPDREFSLTVGLEGGHVAVFKNRCLMKLIGHGVMWLARAEWARIDDYEGNLVVSKSTMKRLRDATNSKQGSPSEKRPYIVYGPTINPTFIEIYRSLSLLRAVEFAIGWLNNHWDSPYWLLVRAPNGKPVVSYRAVKRMYHAEVRSRGGSITEMVVQTSSEHPFGMILSEHRVV